MWQIERFLNVTVGGTYNYRSALFGKQNYLQK